MTTGRGPRRPVTEDERKLWKAVSKQFKPLDRAKREDADEAPAAAKPRVDAKPTRAKEQPAPVVTAPPPKKRAVAVKPSLGDFEARRAKRLSAGRLPIEARLDLHGMRQEEARETLMRFLRAAHNNGLKHVKVITGKGAPAADAELKPFSLFDDTRRGVLRDQVPRWLQSSDARSLVVPACFQQLTPIAAR